MKSLKESILDTDLSTGVEIAAVMDEIVRWYFENKCHYELKGHTMYLQSFQCTPRLDNHFLKAMKQLKVNNIIWDVGRCTPRLYGDWNMDLDIINGDITICCKSLSCVLNCDGYINVQNSTNFKNAQVYGIHLNIEYGNLPLFTGNTKIYTEIVTVVGRYVTEYKKLRNNLFLNELEKFGVISISKWGQISTHLDVTTDLTINKLCGKVFPDVKNISLTQIQGIEIYIGKHFKKGWGRKWEELKLKDGNSLWIGLSD